MAGIRKGTIAPIVIGVLGVAILLMLGSWQVQRLSWKEQLISELAIRMAAEPVSLPASVDPIRDNSLRVKVSGRVAPEELHVLSSVKRYGPGFRVIAPMELVESQRRILVDFGFVPERLKDLSTRADDPRLVSPDQVIEVTGIVRWPNETDGFTPEPDLGRNIWFARDVDTMSAALGTAPVLVIAEGHGLGEFPVARPPGVDIPNKHLEYALTWFGLAIVWASMAIYWLRIELRKHRRKLENV